MANDFAAASDMDAFLINPTIKMMRDSRHGTVDNWVPSDEYIVREAGKNIYQTKPFSPDFSRRYILPQEYSEGEEETTTSQSDDSYGSVFGSTSSEGDADSICSYEDAEIVDANVVAPGDLPLCAKAQQVYLISAGKARVVSVISSAAASPVDSRPQSSIFEEFDSSTAIFGSSKTHQRARLSANNYSHTRSPERRITSSRPPIPHRHASKQSLPRLDATSTAGPILAKTSQTPLTDQRASTTKQDPFPADWPLPPSPISPVSPVSPTVPKRRMPRLFTSNSHRRKISIASDSSGGSIGNNRYFVPAMTTSAARSVPATINTPPLLIDGAHRPTYEAPRRQKLVPRGAGERAPTIVLPPYQSDANWPLRSIALPEHRDISMVKDIKRKSAVATVQF